MTALVTLQFVDAQYEFTSSRGLVYQGCIIPRLHHSGLDVAEPALKPYFSYPGQHWGKMIHEGLLCVYASNVGKAC